MPFVEILGNFIVLDALTGLNLVVKEISGSSNVNHKGVVMH